MGIFGSDITAKLTGSKRLNKKLLKYPDIALFEITKHLTQEAEGIMTAAKQLVPVDTGNLRASGFVRFPEIGRKKVNVQLGFGGPAAAYALRVHEDLNAFHTVGTAKYLSMPFRQAKKGLPKRLAQALAIVSKQL